MTVVCSSCRVTSFEVPIPQMRCLFSMGELQVAGTQVLGTWLLRPATQVHWCTLHQHALCLGQSKVDPQR